LILTVTVIFWRLIISGHDEGSILVRGKRHARSDRGQHLDSAA
jgi:hypothetical protein